MQISISSKIVRRVLWFFRVIYTAAERFYWDNGFAKAASLAYTTLFSLVPVTALGVAVLASFAVSSDNVGALRNFIFQQFVPSTQGVETIVDYMTQFSTTIAQVNVYGILFVLITSLLLINSIETVLNEVWQVYESRPIFSRIANFSAIILLAPIALFSIYFTAKLKVEPFLINNSDQVYSIYAFIFPIVVDFVVLSFLYLLVPKAPVKVSSAIAGAFVAGILFNAAKWGFAIYIVNFTSYDKIYGAISVIPIFLFWLYLAWIIVIWGAEVAYQSQYLPFTGNILERKVFSMGAGELTLALQAMIYTARSFKAGLAMADERELAEIMQCSPVILRKILSNLERAMLITRGNNASMPVTLLKDPSQISILQIREAVYGAGNALLEEDQLTAVYKCIANKNLAQINLAEVL